MRPLLVVAGLLLLAAPVAAQFNSMQGDWWLEVKGDRGVAKLTFSEEQGSSFDVTGAGFSRGFRSFWSVSDEATQSLSFDFEGNISGTIQLEDLTNASSIGMLQITKGKVDGAFTKVKVKGLLTIGSAQARKVTLKGGRLPTTPPAWIGSTHKAKLGGTNVKSAKYDVTLIHAPVLGFPFLAITGDGSVKIDGTARTGVILGGVLLASPKGKLFGEMSFDDELGTAKGRVKEGKEAGPPDLSLTGRVGSDRKVKVDAELDIRVVL